MDELIQALKSPPKKSNQKKRKRKQYPFLPYHPEFTPGSGKLWDIPRDWRINLNGHPKSPDKKAAAAFTATEETANIRHLFSRAGFGANVAEMLQYAATPIADIVTEMLNSQLPAPPGEWINEPFDINEYLNWTPEEQMAFLMLNYERINEMRMWWLEQMMSKATNLQEKMTLYWHGHFTTDAESAVLATFIYKQNDTLRRNALGNFRAFLKEIYKDPGMLLYLDGVSNIVGAPNENFARELLELFTMGVGNYTEDDIKEIARALTGWEIDTYNVSSFFNPNLHDYGQKTIFGQTGNFDGDDVIDIILEQEQTAIYVAGRIYEFFVSRERDEDFINELAATFRNNDYEFKPMLEQLFNSDFFYSEDVKASLIKSPVELTVSNARLLENGSVNTFFVLAVQELINQVLLMPPNVAGWPGQRAWINPTTYVYRNTISEIYVNENLTRDENDNPYITFDPLAFASSFGIETSEELAKAMIDHLIRIPVHESTFDFLFTTLLGTAAPEDWSLQYPGVEQLITDFLIQVVRLPEFHLT